MEAFEDFKNKGEGSSKKKPKPSYEELYKEHVEAIADEKEEELRTKISSTFWMFAFTAMAYGAFRLIQVVADIGMQAIATSPVTTEPGITLVKLLLAFSYCMILAFISVVFVISMIAVWKDELEELIKRLKPYDVAGTKAIREYNKNKRDEDDL